MQPRNVAFVGAICVTIGWLLASTLTPPVARVQTRQERDRAPQISEEPEFTAQLQLRLRQHPPTPEGRRNPFVFATRDVVDARPNAAPRLDDNAASPAMPAMPASVGPAYVLSGIGISGETRTAVLTTTGADAHIVKVDDEVGGYRVVEITEAAVTLARGDERYTLRFTQQ